MLCQTGRPKGFWITSRVSTQRGDRMCGIRSPVTTIGRVALVQAFEEVIISNVAGVQRIASHPSNRLGCQPITLVLGGQISHPSENATYIVRAQWNPVGRVTIAPRILFDVICG